MNDKKETIEDFDAAFNEEQPGENKNTEPETANNEGGESTENVETNNNQVDDHESEHVETGEDDIDQPEEEQHLEMPDFESLYLDERKQRELAEQRYKSFEGRYKKEKTTTIKALRDEIEALRSELTEIKSKKGAESEDTENLLEDFPGLDKLIEQRAMEIVTKVTGQKQSAEVTGEPTSEISADADTTQPQGPSVEELQAQHIAAIKQAHPDLDGIMAGNELFEWIDGLEGSYKTFYADVAQRGTTQQVIDMLTLFKQQRSDKKKKKSKAKPAKPVRSRPAAPQMSDPLGSPDDFDAGWNLDSA